MREMRHPNTASRSVTPQIVEAHKRLLGYQMTRLKRGSNVIYASAAAGKACKPSVGICKSPVGHSNDTIVFV